MVARASLEPGFSVDVSRSRIEFCARQLLVTTTRGCFRRWSANLGWNAKDPSVSASIEIASIDTNLPERDEHLRALFDTKQFPLATFVSTRVTPTKEGYDVVGDLTLRGITRQISLRAIATELSSNRLIFEANTTIDRKRFGVVWSPPIELTSGVSDAVDIELHVEAVRD
jgi:polyisoprenoid-binding protein YceI